MAQAKAKPWPMGFSGFGFGSRNCRPKALLAKAKAGAFEPSRAKAITIHTKKGLQKEIRCTEHATVGCNTHKLVQQ